ncbi:hypothetical protein E4U53_004961, partial [Claviceps sorghi]
MGAWPGLLRIKTPHRHRPPRVETQRHREPGTRPVPAAGPWQNQSASSVRTPSRARRACPGKKRAKAESCTGAGPAGLVAAKTLLHNAPAGEFTVSVFERQEGVGGLWPASASDTARLVHPLMEANQSRHTMHFSDLAWEDGTPQVPRAWQ